MSSGILSIEILFAPVRCRGRSCCTLVRVLIVRLKCSEGERAVKPRELTIKKGNHASTQTRFVGP